MVKNKKGITLVALIVTIIILLILAGVSIATLTDSGLFEKTKEAKEKSENAQIKEEGILADYEDKIGKYVNGTRDEIAIDKISYEELEEMIRKIAGEETINVAKNIQTTGIYDTVYEGIATGDNSTIKKYTLDKDISDYKYLIVYGALRVDNNNNYKYASTIIDVKNYKYYGNEDISIGTMWSEQYYWSLEFSFLNNNTIVMGGGNTVVGWQGTPCIYLIKGIK